LYYLSNVIITNLRPIYVVHFFLRD